MSRLALAVLMLWLTTQAETRHYFIVQPSAMTTNHHTHVQVTGLVTLSKREGDGDWHMRINSLGHCSARQGDHIDCVAGVGFITAECIPEMPCPHPKVGQCVRVRGISRFDAEHKWYECHPVEKLEVVPCK